MSKRKAEVTLLCEDSQHECFFLKLLRSRGRQYREIRVRRPNSSSGSAEQYVRDHFGPYTRAHRRRIVRGQASGLLAAIDADTGTVQQHYDELLSQLDPPRGGVEKIAVFVPRRNIETWIKYLGGEQVSETARYPKLPQARDCYPAVDRFLEIARTRVPSDCPDSLRRAIQDEYPRLP